MLLYIVNIRIIPSKYMYEGVSPRQLCIRSLFISQSSIFLAWNCSPQSLGATGLSSVKKCSRVQGRLFQQHNSGLNMSNARGGSGSVLQSSNDSQRTYSVCLHSILHSQGYKKQCRVCATSYCNNNNMCVY